MSPSTRLRLAIPLLAIALAAPAASGERQDPPSQGPAAQPGDTASKGSTSKPATFDSQQFLQEDTVPRRRDPLWPTVVHGHVELADGARLTVPARIDRICEGHAIPEGFTDLDGEYTLQLGRNATLLADPSVPVSYLGVGGAAPVNASEMWGCELRASLPGYRAESIALSEGKLRGGANLGTLTLQRKAGLAGSVVSRGDAAIPTSAWKAYARAVEAAGHGRAADAHERMERLVVDAPKFVAAWFQLGALRQAAGDAAGARKAYERALELDPDFVPAYEGLSILAARRDDWETVSRLTRAILDKNPDEFPRAHYLGAVASLALGDLGAAEASARRAQALGWDRKEPRTLLLLGTILERKGEYAPAADAVRAYLAASPAPADAARAESLLAALEARSR